MNADTWRGHTETRGSDTRTRTRAAHTRTRTDPRGRRLACTWVMFTGRRGEGPAGRDAQATLSHSRGTHATSPQPTQGSLRTLPAPGPHPQPLSALDVQRARPGRGLELTHSPLPPHSRPHTGWGQETREGKGTRCMERWPRSQPLPFPCSPPLPQPLFPEAAAPHPLGGWRLSRKNPGVGASIPTSGTGAEGAGLRTQG